MPARHAFLSLGLLAACSSGGGKPNTIEDSCETLCDKYASCEIDDVYGYSLEDCADTCVERRGQADAQCQRAFDELASCIDRTACDDLREDLDEGGACFGPVLVALTACEEEIPDEFECGNGVVRPVDWLCDLEDDCGNGADEAPELCMAPCDDRVFQCADAASTAGAQCITARWHCDDVADCADGSDEEGCP